MDFLEKYLIDCDRNFSTAKHMIGKKSLYSYDTYKDETKRLHNEVFTIYKNLKTLFEDAEKEMLNISTVNPMMKNLSYNAALVKINRSMNEILNDMLTTLVLSNKNLTINQSYRQMIEYFCIYFVLSINDDSIASFYMNNNHIIEANAYMKMKNEFKDSNLKHSYEGSVKFFALYHNLTYDEAEEIYSKPFGWAYNVIKDPEGNSIERVSSKNIREYAFRMLKKDLAWNVINTSINTSDEVVHPTPAYLFYLSHDDEDSKFAEAIFNTSIRFYTLILSMSSQIFISQPNRSSTLSMYSRKLQQLDFKPMFERIEFVSNYDEIKKINKYKFKNFSNDDDQLIFLEHLSQSFFDKDNNNKTTYKYLDLTYTLSDTIYLNLRNFVIDLVPNNAMWLNFLSLYWISSFLMHEITVAFAFNNYSLFQKIFRLFVEYTAVLDYLLNSDDVTNENFFSSGFLLLVHTHRYMEMDMNEYDRILNEIKAKVGIQGKQYDGKIIDFCGWTIHKNKKGKFVTYNFGHIVNEMQKKIDPDTGVFKMIMNECNAALHGSLYGEEINNDIIDNSTVPFDYMMIIFRVFIAIHQSIAKYFEILNDEKLLVSNQLMMGTFIGMYKKYGKFVMKRMQEYSKINYKK
jgi:hypothetical protein